MVDGGLRLENATTAPAPISATQQIPRMHTVRRHRNAKTALAPILLILLGVDQRSFDFLHQADFLTTRHGDEEACDAAAGPDVLLRVDLSGLLHI